jgi:hypothetical protein
VCDETFSLALVQRLASLQTKGRNKTLDIQDLVSDSKCEQEPKVTNVRHEFSSVSHEFSHL